MKFMLVLTGGLTLAACSTYSTARQFSYAAAPATTEVESSEVLAESAPSAAPPATAAPAPAAAPPRGFRASASPAPVAERAKRAPQPEERPGLGTLWGETISSRVHDVEFNRSAAPPSLATLYYNDHAGIEAMADYAQRVATVSYDAPVATEGGVTVMLVDASGAALPAFSLGGRIYVVGEAGHRYNIVVHNQTGGRFEVVASVDGLDVIDGQPASIDKHGYLLLPYGELVIDGFRRNQAEVAAFRFGAVKSSYAARTTGDRNVGVVGLAIFAERGAPAITDVEDVEIRRRHSAEPFDSRFARPPSE
jgi:hypothetical protein